MNRFFFLSSTAALFSKNTSHFIQRASFFSYSPTPILSPSITLFWKRRISLNITLTWRFRVQCLSTTSAPPARRRPSSKKKLDNSPAMEEEKDAFYVVRKGDIVGVYKTLNDCQAQVSSSVCDPSVSVYKGYSLPKEAEEYLTSRGLKNASYVINAADAKDDIFGALVSCPFQQPDSCKVNISSKPSPPKRSQEVFGSASNSVSYFIFCDN
ncbi:hypothetical protein IFM89_026289 [Coptis chinensis]|uniref:Ribonuclease H1 N-terminal domain-containing protein n=1 Tax=Coptis chinensis TaxID=261450 RepID=A0A835IYG7_9MAGN|nr:hypothetical protein IFM89_026289 [Coptis chinensis]